jgi:hypothetical protein
MNSGPAESRPLPPYRFRHLRLAMEKQAALERTGPRRAVVLSLWVCAALVVGVTCHLWAHGRAPRWLEGGLFLEELREHWPF